MYRKIWKIKEKAPLLFLIIASTLIMEIAGMGTDFTNARTANSSNEKTTHQTGMFLADFLNHTFSKKQDLHKDDNKSKDTLARTQVKTQAPDKKKDVVAPTQGSEVASQNTAGAQKEDVASQSVAPEQSANTQNQASFLTAQSFSQVDQTYFQDAVFIGDSRTVGLSQYSGLTNATFYANIGMTIYDLFDKSFISQNGKSLTLTQALQQKQFKKVYLMVGINELGRGTPEQFLEKYTQAVQQIEKLQPNAIIFVEGIMDVTKDKSDHDAIFNNTNIKKRNASISTLADNKRIFYIDVNSAVADGSGNLISEYSFDEVHLKAKYYSIWTDFLMKHGIVIK